MSDFVVAVKSHLRAKLFKQQTYEVLKLNNLLDHTYVFVVSEEECNEYINEINDSSVKVIPVHEVGLEKCMNFIADYFPENTRIFTTDDDIRYFWHFDENKNLVKNSNKLKEIIEDGFETIDKYGLGSFSFLHLRNKFWLKDKPWKEFSITTKLGGCGFGVRNGKLLKVPETTGPLDDIFRGIQYLNEFGGILLYNWAGMDTDFGITLGGLQSNGTRGTPETRLAKTKADCERWLVENPTFAEYVSSIYLHKKANLYFYKFKNKNELRKILVKKGIGLRNLVWKMWFSNAEPEFS